MATSSTTRPPGSTLLHPVVLGAIAVLVLNDHWWKAAWPGALTGKLSDFAGLLFFPLLLHAVGEEALGARRRVAGSARRLIIAAAATGVVFSLIKLTAVGAQGYAWAGGGLQWPFRALAALFQGRPLPAVARVSVVQDATDLVALPCLGVAVWLGRRASTPFQQG